jgi:DNA-binding TFAR19-related protein (PDSD5 family)
MSHLPGALELILAIVGILGTIAGGAGYFNANYAKSRIEALNGDLEERDRRYDTLKDDYEDLERRFTEEQHKREESDQKVKVLEKVVTGKQELDEIANVLRVHENRARSIEQSILDMLENGVYLRDGNNAPRR